MAREVNHFPIDVPDDASPPKKGKPGQCMLFESDLSLKDRCAARRQYRTLRLAIYAPLASGYAVNGIYQGCYGHSRPSAKRVINEFYRTLSWYTYIGSK